MHMGGSTGIVSAFSASALDRDEGSTSRSDCCRVGTETSV